MLAGGIKILAKGWLVLLPLWAVWAYIWLCPLNFMDWEVPAFLWNKEFCRKKQDKIYDVAILGDSVANGAMKPLLLSDKTVNLSIPSVGPETEFYVLKEYLEHNLPPKICYMYFNLDHLSCGGDWAWWHRIPYSGRLRYSDTLEIFQNFKRLNDKEFTVARKGWETDIIKYMAKTPDLYLPALKNARFFNRRNNNNNLVRLCNLARGSYSGIGIGVAGKDISVLQDGYGFKSSTSHYYYKKIIELCKENGIAVRIIEMPGSPLRVRTEKMKKEFWATYKELMEIYQNIAICYFDNDYSAVEFTDSYHLNLHGAIHFSREIKERHPEDFIDDEPLSENTLAGLRDYINIADRPDDLMALAERGEFPLLLVDREHDKAIYQCGTKSISYPLPQAGETEASITIDEISDRESTATKKIPAGILRLGKYGQSSWHKTGDNKPVELAKGQAVDYSVLIYDRDGKKIICKKNFSARKEYEFLR